MNKLRKPKPSTTSNPRIGTVGSIANVPISRQAPVSRTMQIASTSHAVQTTTQQVHTPNYPKTAWFSGTAAVKPRTSIEQYWAARALVAETVLSTRVQHGKEVAEVRLGEEEVRTKEIAALIRSNEQRQSRLEKFVAVLVACLALLFFMVLHMSLRDSQKTQASSHFTIPILSPFTSVVEHETGIISTKTVTIFIVVMGILSYAMFRHWISGRRVIR